MSTRTAKRVRPGIARRGSSSSFARVRVSEMQRSRLLGAAAAVVEEQGYARATVAHITARARVSRRTFYDLFENREACFAVLIEDVLATVEGEIARAELDGLSWRERVRGGLVAILSFFDREPVLARVCVVQSLRGGPAVLQRREEILARLTVVLDAGRSGEGAASGRGGSGVTELTAEGLIGASLAIVHTRLQREQGTPPLTSLVGELMSMIVLPYLGAAAARRELNRPLPAQAGSGSLGGASGGMASPPVAGGDPLAGVPMRLTYRTALVLGCIADEPGASNRVIGDRAGVSDQGQVSKLLARLQRLGLAANTGVGHTKGEPNAWSLTSKGAQVERGIRAHTDTHENGSVVA
jgi:AcrR family transcriptional regulator